MHSRKLLLGIIVLVLIQSSCNQKTGADHKGQSSSKALLAQVYNKKLFSSDLEGILPENYKAQDSIMIYNAYIENWLRDAVLMQEAERKIAQNLDIDKLVMDYRSTLILHNYEKIIVETQLDSVINQQEIQQFYENNKENYQLEKPLLRALYMKIPKNAADLEQVDKWWSSEDVDDQLHLIEYCNTYAEVYFLNEEEWHDLEKIKSTLPTNLINNTTFNQIGTDINRTDDLYKYYLRVKEVIQQNEAPPMDYIEEKAKQVILQRRKAKLLQLHRENLYKKEINNSNVKVYTK